MGGGGRTSSDGSWSSVRCSSSSWAEGGGSSSWAVSAAPLPAMQSPAPRQVMQRPTPMPPRSLLQRSTPRPSMQSATPRPSMQSTATRPPMQRSAPRQTAAGELRLPPRYKLVTPPSWFTELPCAVAWAAYTPGGPVEPIGSDGNPIRVNYDRYRELKIGLEKAIWAMDKASKALNSFSVPRGLKIALGKVSAELDKAVEDGWEFYDGGKPDVSDNPVFADTDPNELEGWNMADADADIYGSDSDVSI